MTLSHSINNNRIFLWLLGATLTLLCIPLVAMQLTSSVQWSGSDFIIMGSLLFGSGSLVILATRKLASPYRFIAAVTVIGLFLYLWAELAVGIFFHVGS